MIAPEHRKVAIELIDEAVQSGARLKMACPELGISRRTYDRWRRQYCNSGEHRDRRSLQKNPLIAQQRRLSDEERQEVLSVCNSEQFASKPPSQIVPILAEQGRYLCSESTMYRIFKEQGQNQQRGRARRLNKPAKPEQITATAPGQCFSWDITFLPTLTKGMFFKLYMILDLFSRSIVGWEVHERESGEYAAQLLKKTQLKERIAPGALTLHSDNGSPMKSETMLAMMERLGVASSFSRPSVSNDNPFSEAAFRTMKYVPMYPEKPFETLDEARKWVHRFVTWYNTEHRHSGINYVTPESKHKGQDERILEERDRLYKQARALNPLRWSGETRNWSPVREVTLNPDENAQENKLAA